MPVITFHDLVGVFLVGAALGAIATATLFYKIHYRKRSSSK